MDARMSGLMQQTAAKNSFDDTLEARAAAPIFESYRLAVLNKDEPTQAAIRAANPNIRGWDKAIAEEQKTERGYFEQARTDKDAERRDRLNATADQISAAQLPATLAQAKVQLGVAQEAQLAQEDVINARKLDATLAEALQKRTEAETLKIPKFSTENAFPNSSGTAVLPATKAPETPLTGAEIAAVNESILRGGTGFTPPKTGDTATADNFVRDLVKSRQYTPAFLEKNLARIRSSFDSTSRGTRVGNDAAVNARDNAKERVIMEERANSGWGAPGSADVKTSYNTLAEEVPNLIDTASGNAPAEDIRFIQGTLGKLAMKGIEVQKGVFVTPSVDEVRAALRSAEGGWWLDNSRSNDFVDKLRENMRKQDIPKRIQEAEDYKQYKRKQAVNSIVNAK